MIVRVVLPIEQYGDNAGRRSVAAWLEQTITPRLPGATVTQRADSGIIVRAAFGTGDKGLGALEAGAGVLELIYQAIDAATQTRPQLREYLGAVRFANITIRPETS